MENPEILFNAKPQTILEAAFRKFFKILINFSNFTGNTCAKPLFNKAARLKACSFVKKRLQHRYFSVNFGKYLRTPFLQNTSSGCFCTSKQLYNKSTITSAGISFFLSGHWKHQNNVWNLFKVNNKDTKMMLLTAFWCLYC